MRAYARRGSCLVPPLLTGLLLSLANHVLSTSRILRRHAGATLQSRVANSMASHIPGTAEHKLKKQEESVQNDQKNLNKNEQKLEKQEAKQEAKQEKKLNKEQDKLHKQENKAADAAHKVNSH